MKTSALVLLLLLAVVPAHAFQNPVDAWLDMVSRTQADQPHWVTPVATTTPRLEQEFRYDFNRLGDPDGTTTINFGAAKGLELIPERHIELIMGVPPYIEHNSAAKDGAGDVSLLLKYRILSANEEHGNYIVTFFLGAALPTGSYRNGATDASVTPTIAAGKGFGHFDLQSTLGKTFPTGNTSVLGRPVALNNAFQYHLAKKLWPEVEINSTFFPDGANAGKKQAFVTPGLVVGRFPIHNRVALTLGTGFQIATTRFHSTNHNWIFSLRLPF